MGVPKYFLYVATFLHGGLMLTRKLKGQFRKSLPLNGKVIVGATKWCVFRPVDPTRVVVEAAIAERLMRMQTNRVDLLQVYNYLSIS